MDPITEIPKDRKTPRPLRLVVMIALTLLGLLMVLSVQGAAA